MSRLALVAAVLALAACTHRIPNSDIQDTPDTRAILGVIDQYRQAVERRDATAILKVVSRRYFDDQGTPDPADDLDFSQLAKALPDDLARLSGARLDIGVKEIEVNPDATEATADVFYDGHFRITTPRGEVPKAESDVSRMRFRKENGAWKVTSGL